MKSIVLPLCLLLSVGATSAQPLDARTGPSTASLRTTGLSEANRKVVAGRILLKWGGYVEKVHGAERRAWAAALWPTLASADLGNLDKALKAVTYEGMRNALLGQQPRDDQVLDRLARSRVPAGDVAGKALGSLAEDLVFTPVTPCRIVDTRVLGGPLQANNSPVPLYVSQPDGNFTAYGGSNTNCDIPAHPAAVALSVTALNNTTKGFLRVFPYGRPPSEGSPVPLNSIGAVVTNDMIVPSMQMQGVEPGYPGLSVYSTATTHYAVFITGYFMAPKATGFDCYGESVWAPLDNWIPTSVTATCQQPGYTPLSGGCDTLGQAGISTVAFNGSETGWGCTFLNESSTTQNVRATVRCCRVPGR